MSGFIADEGPVVRIDREDRERSSDKTNDYFSLKYSATDRDFRPTIFDAMLYNCDRLNKIIHQRLRCDNPPTIINNLTIKPSYSPQEMQQICITNDKYGLS